MEPELHIISGSKGSNLLAPQRRPPAEIAEPKAVAEEAGKELEGVKGRRPRDALKVSSLLFPYLSLSTLLFFLLVYRLPFFF